jgi:ParB family transcriptional regulator, chromosome partitioning protein
MGASGTLADLDPEQLDKNPNNPRRYFNEDRLDLLRTSIQEVGILVPLIVYRAPGTNDQYVLMDGERRWRCALDLALPVVPVNIIDAPSPLDNLLRMFNIHNVREDWPLISVSLSLREVMSLSHETGEKRIAEMTGLTRSTVRRAKRLLSLPTQELDLIQSEAHLDRPKQVHREDLYLEIEAAESVLSSELPEIRKEFSRDEIIRRFATKAEIGALRAVTDFRYVSKLVKAVDDDIVERSAVVKAARQLIMDPTAAPNEVFDNVAAFAYHQHSVQRKIEVLLSDLDRILSGPPISDPLRGRLADLRDLIDTVIRDH